MALLRLTVHKSLSDVNDYIILYVMDNIKKAMLPCLNILRKMDIHLEISKDCLDY